MAQVVAEVVDDGAEWSIVAPRLPSLRPTPITFAHRGARAHAPENTIEAFVLAARLGSNGMESDVWVTADGVAVLDHDGVVGRSLRKRPISEVRRADLPAHIPSLDEYYDAVGPDFDLSLDLKDPNAFAPTLAAARNAGGESKLWLCHDDIDYLESLRPSFDGYLVDSTRLRRITEGVERRAVRLQASGIDAINMRHPDWTGGLVTLFHRFGRHTFGWDAQHPRELSNLFDAGIDGVFSDHVDRMIATFSEFYPSVT